VGQRTGLDTTEKTRISRPLRIESYYLGVQPTSYLVISTVLAYSSSLLSILFLALQVDIFGEFSPTVTLHIFACFTILATMRIPS